ncbi:MAG: hypothetical protein QNJ70_28830 [Xenococcaceae cyanobacterium MO_207.B15]|nr:hypothetical protein [Xenococcaceae cyanobacterium MO_207.B15]
MKYSLLQEIEIDDIDTGKYYSISSYTSSSSAMDIKDMGEIIRNTRRLLEKAKHRHEGERLNISF